MYGALILLILQLVGAPQDPLGDPDGFLTAAKERLRGIFLFTRDDRGLRHYLWTREFERNRLNSKRQLTRGCRELLLECFDSPDGLLVRRTVEKCGEILKRDITPAYNFTSSWYDESVSARAIELREQLWAITQFKLVGRETLNGRASIVFAFRTPKNAGPGVSKINKKHVKRALKTRGRVWFDEDDKMLVKVEGEYYGRVVLRKGFFIGGRSISKGSSWAWEMKKFDDETWLPTYYEQLYRRKKFFSTTFYQELIRYSKYVRRKRSVPE